MPTTTTNRSSGTHRRLKPVESRDPWGEDSAWDFRFALPGFFAKAYPRSGNGFRPTSQGSIMVRFSPLRHINQATRLRIDAASEFSDPIPQPKGERLMLA